MDALLMRPPRTVHLFMSSLPSCGPEQRGHSVAAAHRAECRSAQLQDCTTEPQSRARLEGGKTRFCVKLCSAQRARFKPVSLETSKLRLCGQRGHGSAEIFVSLL